MYHTTGFTKAEIAELCAIIEARELSPRMRRWPPVLGLRNALTVTLTYLRRNRVQAEIAENYGVSQPTISRAISAITPLLVQALLDYVPTADELDTGTCYIVDGTLLPCWSWRAHRELYSGKHKTTGMNVQVAHTLICIAWAVMKYDGDYSEAGEDYYEQRDQRNHEHLVRHHQQALARLGYQVTLIPPGDPSPPPEGAPVQQCTGATRLVGLVLAQDLPQVVLVPGEGAVQELAAGIPRSSVRRSRSCGASARCRARSGCRRRRGSRRNAVVKSGPRSRTMNLTRCACSPRSATLTPRPASSPVDPAVPPFGVVPGQPEDEGPDVPAGRRPSGPAAHGPRRPAAPGDVAAPARDRLRGDQQPQPWRALSVSR